MHDRLGEALKDCKLGPFDRARVVKALEAALEEGWCLVCGYKQKATTGGNLGEIDYDDPITQQILDRRGGTPVLIISALRQRPWSGCTDEELAKTTKLFPDSCKAMRARLGELGWVEDSGKHRDSSQGRPMTVWILTKDARALLRP
jgi:hypothetical protein